ncbi:FHA domain-containing protein [Plasmodiophora brassicae]
MRGRGRDGDDRRRRDDRDRSPRETMRYGDRFGRRALAEEQERKAAEKPVVKAKINLEPTGLLDALDASGNEVAGGVRLQYHEPRDAAATDEFWRLYVFKDGKQIETLHIHRKTCFRIGRERKVADVPLDHPSCSKQHAVIQFRRKTTRDVVGDLNVCVRPYIIDLGSTNGTFLNGDRLEPARFYELLEKDVIRFGQSTREYIVLHANSKS